METDPRERPAAVETPVRSTTRVRPRLADAVPAARRGLAACLLMALIPLGPALAAGDDELAELQRLQVVLNIINQEIQSNYQEMRAIAEMRKSYADLALFTRPSPDPIDKRAEEERLRGELKREGELRDRLDQLFARTRELEAQRQPLMRRVVELALRPRPAE